MTKDPIIQNMILRLGQSQDQRRADELRGDFVRVDERRLEDLLAHIGKLAALVNYYQNEIKAPAGNWSTFFPAEANAVKELLEGKSASTPPHLALLLAFLRLYQKEQEVLNRITGRHLDFYFKEVLRLTNKAAVPDKAHVLVELKKNVAPVLLTPDHLFSAGKDENGVELLYAPTGKTVINAARVDGLRSIFLDRRSPGTVRWAAIANSSDGAGGELKGEEPKWYGFGYEELHPAEMGFALASPVLRLQEGSRAVTVELTLNNVNPAKLSDTNLKGAFEVRLTGEKDWLPCAASATLALNILTLTFTIEEGQEAVVDYKTAIHRYNYTAQAPVLQVLLKSGPDSTLGYNDLAKVVVMSARIKVVVSGIKSLSLENDYGTLDAKKAFMPFGPQPVVGSRFLVRCREALTKKLSQLDITVRWQGIKPPTAAEPAEKYFENYYKNYGPTVNNSYFTASVSCQDGSGRENLPSPRQLFDFSDPAAEHTITILGLPPMWPKVVSIMRMRLSGLEMANTAWARKLLRESALKQPVNQPSSKVAPEPPEGFIRFSLDKDFLHSTYRQVYVENAMKYSKQGSAEPAPVTLNEPYTPTMQSISLGYTASSDDVKISSILPDDFANPDLQFFHLSYFGAMREHGYQRQQFQLVPEVPLLPDYTYDGELLIGFQDLKGGDSVSVLFQVAEGSAEPDKVLTDPLSWSVVCDNYWKELGKDEVVGDTTNQLRTSGIITFVIPTAATTSNTIMPSGRIWLKAAAMGPVKAVCQLIEVAANAVEVQFRDSGNAPGHLLTALPSKKISKLKDGPAGIKSARQPYASFGGRAVEADEAFHTRVSERLRHKNRGVTAWDYERLVLEAFPKVNKVKCIPHAKEGSWLAPGHVLLVVVPDLKHMNAVDPLRPRVDTATLADITEYVQKRTRGLLRKPNGEPITVQVQVQVKNPTYQRVRLDFKVKFQSGKEFNFYRKELDQALVRFLSPWAHEAGRDISFGSKIYKSVVLNFVENLDYVDYVTDFKMYSYVGEVGEVGALLDINEAQPETPDAILVSAENHSIDEAP